MQVNFLQARQALTKEFVRLPDGTIDVEPYPHVNEFKSHTHEVVDLPAFYNLLIDHASKGHCLLKGTLIKPLNWESRAGSTDPNVPTEYMVLDVDGLPDHTVEKVMAKMNMHQIDYIVQYSSSQGVLPNKGLSCHIFVQLDRLVTPYNIKQWLIERNLKDFNEYLRLTASGVALHYPIDVTACQNDKLIYIAPPKCTPPELDQFKAPRIQLVMKGTPQ